MQFLAAEGRIIDRDTNIVYILRCIWKKDAAYGIIDTEEAGTLVFSGVPAFFVTIVLLVQCSVKQKFIVVQPMKTSL